MTFPLIKEAKRDLEEILFMLDELEKRGASKKTIKMLLNERSKSSKKNANPRKDQQD